jgi:hypothetical protein
VEERRFDELTRALGRGTSRRRVVKGLLAGVVAAVVGKTSVPAPAVAAGGTCSSQTYTKCLSDSKLQYDSLTAHCGTTDGPQWAGNACAIVATLWYARAIDQCQRAQCPKGMSCVDDHCCRGENCCQSDQIHCPGPGTGLSGGTCCPAGTTCCEGGCCPPENTCCLNYTLTFINPSAAEVCTDLQTDPNNCGACRHKCAGLPCIDGTCQCPAGDSICKGPLNQTCCAPNEYCQGSAFGGVECVPRCSPCETYDPTNSVQPCQPLECDACQTCDPTSGQCTPSDNGTACGSDLFCCGGQCVSETCSGAQTFNDTTCQCECPQVSCPGGGLPDPTTCQCGCSSTPPDSCVGPNKIWHPETCFCEIDCGPYGCGG